MLLTVAFEDRDLFHFEVDGDVGIDNLKAMLEATTEVPQVQQGLFYNGRELQTGETLQAVGITGDDVIAMVRRAPPQPRATPASAPAQQSRPQQGLQFQQPANSFDELDLDMQARIAEHIRQQNIQQNMENAWEHSPEVFSDVYMLYVKMTINSIDLKVFVDSGAQRSIMSRDCAQRCNLLHLLDTRFSGVARGVGEGKILGRIHSATVRVASEWVSMGITVLESGGMDCLFGLDMLRRYGCAIDLKANVLRFQNLDNQPELPFLPEHELPDSAKLFAAGRPANGEGQLIMEPGSSSRPPGGTPASSAPAAAAAGAAASARAASNAPISGSSQSAGPAAQMGTRSVANAPILPQSVANAQQQSAGGEARHVQELQRISGQPAEHCLNALRACDGNVEAAAGLLLGL